MKVSEYKEIINNTLYVDKQLIIDFLINAYVIDISCIVDIYNKGMNGKDLNNLKKAISEIEV